MVQPRWPLDFVLLDSRLMREFTSIILSQWVCDNWLWHLRWQVQRDLLSENGTNERLQELCRKCCWIPLQFIINWQRFCISYSLSIYKSIKYKHVYFIYLKQMLRFLCICTFKIANISDFLQFLFKSGTPYITKSILQWQKNKDSLQFLFQLVGKLVW
jgi:hypothetical protein